MCVSGWVDVTPFLRQGLLPPLAGDGPRSLSSHREGGERGKEKIVFFWPGLCLRAEAGGPRGAFSSRKRPRVCEEGKEFRSFSNGKGERYW